MEGSPSKAKKVQSARPGKKMQVVKNEENSELQEVSFTAKRAKSISATKNMRIGDGENNDNKEEEKLGEVIELPEETFLAKKEATKARKNSVGELLNKKISVESALNARTQKKKENIPENNETSPNILEIKEEKEEKEEEGEGDNNDDSKKLSKEERRAKRKKKQERRDKRKEKLEINLEDDNNNNEGGDKGGDIEINEDNNDNVDNLAERKSSINDILTRRSSIGIVSPRNPLIQSKTYKSEHQLESDEGKVNLSKPQSESSGNRVLYQQVGSQLHYHTATGNWEIVKDLIESNPEAIEHRSEDGRTILHISSSLGHLSIVKGLLEREVDINITMNNGLTPLMLCTAQGKADVVQLLLDFGASYCTQTVKDGYTALHLACMHRQVRTAQVLLSFIKEQTLAQKSKGKKDAKAIMSGTLPLNEYIEVRSTKGYSAFHLATVEGDLAILQLLVEFGADYKATTSKKWTPLHFAAHIGNMEICQFLLTIDSNMVDLKNEAKEKPFDIAVFQKHESILELLTPKIQSKPKKPKKKKEKKEKKEKKNNNNNEEIIIELPKFEGDIDECLIDRVTKRPALLKEMKEDGTVFMAQIPPDSQMLLFNEAKDNPHLLEELLSIGREVLIELIEENPHLLLSTVQSPISILKKVKTPAKLFKLLKQVEENPMMFMKDDCREDPELFFLQQLRDNPYLRYLVVSKLREKKPSLLPLIKAFIGIEADEIQEPEEEKSMKAKMTNKLMKATVSKYLKKIIDSDGKDVNIAGLDPEGLQQLKDVMQEDDVGKLMAKKGINGPLFSLEEIPDVEELPFDELD